LPTILKLYNLSVSLTTDNSILKYKIKEFISKFYLLNSNGFGNPNSKYTKPNAVKLFCGIICNSIYLHRNQFTHLKHYLNMENYPLHIDETIDYTNYEIELYDYSLNEGWVPYEYQDKIIEFITDNKTKTKLIPIQTGKGKSLIALAALSKIKCRVGLIIQPTFIEKWVSDITTVLSVKINDILVIQGSKNLKLLIEMAQSDSLDDVFIIFSARTLQEFISSYEENPDDVFNFYGITPIELFPLAKIGAVLLDESHMHFHALYKTLLYTNVKLQIGLTATLLSDNNVVKNTHNIMYPPITRYEDLAYDCYVDVYPIKYTINNNNIKLIRTREFSSNNYSHQAFEKSIMKVPFLKTNYFKLIKEIIENYYIESFLKDDKLIIFVASVDMATSLVAYINEIFPEYTCKRYCQEDPYSNAIEPDIRVTTVISAGTGIDIPNLRVAIQTIAISSTVSNIQTLGRLRKLKDRDVKFIYLYSGQIAKHIEYHNKRKEIFSGKVKNTIDRGSKQSL